MATAKAERFYVCLSILYEGILSGNVGGFVVLLLQSEDCAAMGVTSHRSPNRVAKDLRQVAGGR